MQRKKILTKLVKNLLKAAFDKETFSSSKNKLNEKKVLEHLKSLKKLPSDEAIFSLSLYLKGLKQLIDKHTMIVETAVKLSKLQENLIKAAYNKNFKLEIKNYKFVVSPSLLGGIKVKIGDSIFDDSLKARIEKVKGAISNNF